MFSEQSSLWSGAAAKPAGAVVAGLSSFDGLLRAAGAPSGHSAWPQSVLCCCRVCAVQLECAVWFREGWLMVSSVNFSLS